MTTSETSAMDDTPIHMNPAEVAHGLRTGSLPLRDIVVTETVDLSGEPDMPGVPV